MRRGTRSDRLEKVPSTLFKFKIGHFHDKLQGFVLTCAAFAMLKCVLKITGYLNEAFMRCLIYSEFL